MADHLDSLRTSLIVTAHCSECGGLLKFSSSALNAYEQDFESGLPSGAHAQNVRISVHPCDACKDRYSQPLRKIASALRDIESIAEP